MFCIRRWFSCSHVYRYTAGMCNGGWSIHPDGHKYVEYKILTHSFLCHLVLLYTLFKNNDGLFMTQIMIKEEGHLIYTNAILRSIMYPSFLHQF